MIFNRENSSDRVLQIIPWLAALIFAALIIILLPTDLFKKYKLEYYHQIKTLYSRNYFTDLNDDNFSEWIEIAYNYGSKEFPYLMVFSNIDSNLNFTIHDQINFTPIWIEDTPPLFDDYDGNGIKEAFFFTTRNDSLFLTGINPFDDDGVFVEVFVTIVSKRKETFDFKVYTQGLYDLNRDGFKEVVFKVVAGFTKNPRKFYAYDIYNDTLFSSQSNFITFGNSISHIASIYDDSLGWIFTAGNYSAENVDPKEFPDDFSDYYTWIFALDGKMDFLFDPIKIDTLKSSLQLVLVRENNNTFIYGQFGYKNNRFDNKLFKYDLHGNLIKEKTLERKTYNSPRFRVFESNVFLYYSSKGKHFLASIDPKLNIGNPVKVENISKGITADVDGNDAMEHITYNGSGKSLVVYRNNFDHPTEIEIQTKQLIEDSDISVVRLSNGQQLIAIQTVDHLAFFEYNYNRFYFLKYPLWISIYLFFAFSIQFILRYQRKNLLQKYERERKMTELELLTIKTQIDPHFILNAVNSLGNVIFSQGNHKQKAYQFLVNLSSLIRDTLQKSQKLSISLKEELEFVENYLKLQQYRFNNSFDYEIKNALTEAEKVQVPKMIIQTFAENAVKHGLAHKKDEKGKLTIQIKKMNAAIQIEITDNGIGRQKAARVSKGSTGKGLGIIDQIIMLYNRLKNTNVSYEAIDLKENEKPSGTKIIIRV